MNHILLFYLTIVSFVFISCAYFNTFYNAETSYNKALIIIEESPIASDEQLPSQANNLLAEAIENSKLVIQNYPESKYIDDAVFIIGKASFVRGEVAVAEKYFKMIMDLYSESKFYELSEIWLAYTHFRMGMVDSAITELKIIQGKYTKNKKQLFIIHNMLAEISMEKDSLEQVYYHYELAAGYASTNSKKTATYGQLAKIAENDGDKKRASIYLQELGKVAPDKIRIESKMQWIIYQRELGEFDKIIDEIESLLGLSEFKDEYIKLDLELGKVYMDKRDYTISKDIFSQMVEIYSKKNETAEAYYHLGHMALREDFNLDLAKEYFEKSKSEKSQSTYGKKSKEILNKIVRFENLESLYKDVVKNTYEEIDINPYDFEEENNNAESEDDYQKDEIIPDDSTGIEKEKFSPEDRFKNSRGPIDFDISSMLEAADLSEEDEEVESNFVSPDSVLFIIGEMLLYDFNHLERSLEKLKTLAEDYPQSRFAPQALYVLSHFEPDGDWQVRLETDFPNSSFFSTDSTSNTEITTTWFESRRDYAWSLAQQSYEDAYKEFNRLYTEDNDTLSAYITGYISDIYLNDIEGTVQHYQSFLNNAPDHIYSTTVKNRLKEIKQNLEDLIDISQQGIDYQIAVNYLLREFNYDSVKVLLTEISSGTSSSYKDAANNLKISIRDYKELSEGIYQQNTQSSTDTSVAEMTKTGPTAVSEMDSILFHLAQLFSYELEFLDSAEYYHKEIIKSYVDSKFRPHSLLYLSEFFPEDNWAKLLAEDYPDTTFTPYSTIHHSIYLSDIFKEDFAAKQEELIDNCELYLKLFHEPVDSSLMFPDSTGIELDSLFLPSDSTGTQIYLDSLYQTMPIEKEEITP